MASPSSSSSLLLPKQDLQREFSGSFTDKDSSSNSVLLRGVNSSPLFRQMARQQKASASSTSATSCSSSGSRRLPGIGQFAAEVKKMLGVRYPKNFLVSELGSLYQQEFGSDFDVDPEK